MSTMSKRFTYIIGIVMVFSMLASTVVPLLSTTVQQQVAATEQPTPLPTPTLPAPIADLSSITFDRTYLHPSGLFTVNTPSGWQVTTTDSTENQVLVNMRNGELLSIVESSVILPAATVSTAEDLNQVFTSEWLSQSWRSYSSAQETGRRVEGDSLLIDFNLTQGRNSYIARHKAWTDGEWVYAVRVITLDNASEMLRYVLDGVAETVKPLKVFSGTPFEWRGYFDTEAHHLIRYSADWNLTDSAPGLPASISGEDVVLRIEAVEGMVDSEEAAKSWIENWRAGVTALTVNPVEQAGGIGYAVSYNLTTVEGETESGLAVLLNGTDGRLHVANARVQAGGIDLNDSDQAANYRDVVAALETFALLPEIELPQ